MTQTTSPKWWHLRSSWALIASVAYISGAAIAFCSANWLLNHKTTGDELTAWLTGYVVIGLLFSGLGQLMSASAHGARSRAGARYDGVGKSVAIFGWSLGLMGATFFALEGTVTPDWVLNLVIFGVLVPPLLTIFWSFISTSKDNDGPRTPADRQATVTQARADLTEIRGALSEEGTEVRPPVEHELVQDRAPRANNGDVAPPSV